MRITGIAAALLMLSGLGVSEAMAQSKYTYVVIVAAPDTKQQQKTLLDAIEGTLEGRDCSGVGQDLYCESFWFLENPTVQADVLLVINGDVANNLGNQLDRASAAYRRLTFGVVHPRAELIRRGLLMARNDGAAAAKVLQAGESVPAVNLLASFVPY